ncbi:MAG: DUF4348 domain-containing protein [Bacteroidales bacterium]|nr:DUF4348 domain-containing protein [Bacteroidales bacterium]
MKILRIALAVALLFSATNVFAQKTENFKTFWKSFVADSVFQKERTQFPLTSMYYQYGEIEEEHDDLITEKISADDWWFLILEDQYSKNKIKKENDGYIVEQIGIENGIYIKFTFKAINGKWYLVKILA